MATYEYACSSCGRRVEVSQGFSEAPLETCDQCGGRLRRVFHPVGVLFRGSGFYSTDARSAKSRQERKAGGEATKGEGKPEAAAPKKPSEAASQE
jgi:putative FmdB family regulatory protein